MSHSTTMEVNMKVSNETDLIASLKAHFGEDSVEIHTKPTTLNTYYDKPSDLKAHIIVRRKFLSKKIGHNVLSNDLGYTRQDDGTYKMTVDDAGFSVKDRNKVAQDYTERVSVRKMKAQGFMTKKTMLPNGHVKLTCERYS